VICGGLAPDHATIARFVVDHQDAMEGLFVSGLRLCAAAGLVSLDTIAVDGTKMGTDAALDANHGAEWIRTQVHRLLAEGVATDSTEAARAAQPALLGMAAPAHRELWRDLRARYLARQANVAREGRAALLTAGVPDAGKSTRSTSSASSTTAGAGWMPAW